MSLGRRAAAVSAALDSRIWRQSFINAASEKAFAVVFQISLQRNYSDQHHILTVPDNPLSSNLFQTRVSIFPPKSTSAARIGSSVTLADCPPRQRSPRQKRRSHVNHFYKNVHGFLFVVGANPRVHPAALSCQTDFEQESNGFLPGRTHGCAPTHFFISSAQIAAAVMRPMLPKNNFLFDKIGDNIT